MPASVELDTSRLEAGVRNLAAGLERAGPREGFAQAQLTARAIRAGVPVRTGRLASTVSATRDARGGAVSYGGGLPYADYIEARAHAVEDALSGVEHEFHQQMTDAAEQEVRRL